MNSVFHTMLHAAGNVLRVHSKSMKCGVSFSQGTASTILSEVDTFIGLHV